MKLRQFRVQLALRLAGLFLALLVLAFGITAEFRMLALISLGTLAVLLAMSLVRFINHTNQELENFLTGLKFGDFQQTYSIAHLGPSFRAMEETLHETVERFKQLRARKEQQAIYSRALVQHIPVPFFIVHGSDRVEILNNATRRTFNVADITNTSELINFGTSFQRDVMQIQPGEALLTTVELSGIKEYYIMTATQITFGGAVNKLVSLQNVQSELDATELATWQNMLRVTSHEIINSLTPVSTCAQMARSQVLEVLDSNIRDDNLRNDLQDIDESLDTLLRRSEGLMRFIQSYRLLSKLPPPRKMKIAVADYFQHLESLIKKELARKGIELTFRHKPASMSLMADEDMLDQVLINLIRNAADTLANTDGGKISVIGYLDGKQRTVLEVRDNGEGVSEDMAEKIFMPFFTTKKQGSGIGLALVRHIMLSHGGSVSYTPGNEHGSVFRLIF